MYIIRPIESKDLGAMIKLAFSATLGITSLPKNEKRLKTHLDIAEAAFQKKSTQPEPDLYLFVLEDLESGTIGGISGIFATTGFNEPLYYYKIVSFPLEKSFSEMPNAVEALKVSMYETGPTEICSLYLDDSFRKEGLGRLLSFSRFHFIASFKERFCDTIFAEMRGYIDENQESPFWNGFGRHFLDIEFTTLMSWRDFGTHLLPQILPKHPVYIPLLSESTKNAIGKVHKHTEPAMHMLLGQGFKLSKEIDVFDAGPRLIAEINEIQEIKDSITAEVNDIRELAGSGVTTIISNDRIDFRACFGELQQNTRGHIILDRKTASALNVQVGEKIRFSLVK